MEEKNQRKLRPKSWWFIRERHPSRDQPLSGPNYMPEVHQQAINYNITKHCLNPLLWPPLKICVPSSLENAFLFLAKAMTNNFNVMLIFLIAPNCSVFVFKKFSCISEIWFERFVSCWNSSRVGNAMPEVNIRGMRTYQKRILEELEENVRSREFTVALLSCSYDLWK